MEIEKKELLVALGKRIKAIRTEKKMTQKELALSMGKDTQAIERLERGGTNPTYYFLYQVAAGLEISIKDIMSE